MKGSKESIIAILKEKYEYENERKRYFDGVINLPVSLLAFIVGGLYFIISEGNKPIWFNNIKSYIIIALLGSTIVSMFYLFRVFFGLKRRYCSFPSTKVVLEDYEKIKKSLEKTPQNGDIDDAIDNKFNEFIIYWYKDINENNIIVNDIRAENFHNSKIFIGISYLLGILVFILYCITKL